jgi:PhzF family phenazine biosynthesis protein
MRFHTRSGPLGVVPKGDGAMAMDFPSRPPVRCDAPAGLANALGLPAPLEALRSRDLVIVLARAEEVRALRPDLGAIAAMEAIFAVCVTAPGTGSDADVDFVSRFFAPAKGVPEDPVTGSAHCSLAPLWAERLGTHALRARQVSARGGELSCEVAGDRVRLEGRAVLVEQGTIFLP